ncbi:MAG: phage antirepressor N-terminal domain-containing protein [Streptosporangiales bacterium]
MSDLVTIPFHGDDLLTVEVDGKPHIVLKEALDAIGLEVERQRRKLDGRSWARTGLTPVRQGDGRVREVTTCDVRTFLMLLATVDERRVSEHIRPKLVQYQAEVADAIEAYWTDGGAINPRATEDQLATIVSRAESQAKVLSALRGVVDKAWLDAKGRHVAARALGEEPEVDSATRPLTVGEFLEDKGVTGEALRSLSTRFGKSLKAAFVDRYDRQPPKVERFVSGALREVAGYTEKHRPLFEQVWTDISA